MSDSISAMDQRRALRKHAHFTAVVTDVITGQALGHLGNLSAGGMLLISPRPPVSEAVYQVSFALPSENRASQIIEAGIQEQWHEAASSPGQVWAGYRIVAISDADAALLDAWLEQPGQD